MKLRLGGMWDASRTAEIIAAAILLLCAVGGYVAVPQLVSGWAFAMPGTTDTALTPTFFPRVAMVLIAVASFSLLLTAASASQKDEIPLVQMTREDWGRIGTVFGLILLFFVGLWFVGFVAAASLFIAAISLLLGYSRVAIVATVAIVSPLLITAVFRYGLKVLLPPGILF